MKKASDKKFLKALGKRIRELRRGQKMTQDQLSFETGIRREQVIRIEAGTQATGVDILKKIGDAFEMPLKDLFDFDY